MEVLKCGLFEGRTNHPEIDLKFRWNKKGGGLEVQVTAVVQENEASLVHIMTGLSVKMGTEKEANTVYVA